MTGQGCFPTWPIWSLIKSCGGKPPSRPFIVLRFEIGWFTQPAGTRCLPSLDRPLLRELRQH